MKLSAGDCMTYPVELRNDCGAQHRALRGFLESGVEILQRELRIDDLLEWKPVRFAMHEIERLDQVPRVVVVDAAHGDPSLHQHIGVDRDVRVRVDQAAEHVAAADAQHLQALRDHLGHAADFDHSVGAVGRHSLRDLGDDVLFRAVAADVDDVIGAEFLGDLEPARAPRRGRSRSVRRAPWPSPRRRGRADRGPG